MQEFPPLLRSLIILIAQASFNAVIAPGAIGLLRWFNARLQQRRGADIFQPYRDLSKLTFHRQSIIPEPTSGIFWIAPPVIIACYFLLGGLLPSFFLTDLPGAPAPWRGLDLLFVIYLLGLAKFIAGLAAFDTATPFGSMSNGRQFFLHILVEPVFLATVYALALKGHTSNLDRFIADQQKLSVISVFANPVMILVLLSLSTIFLAENGRLPFDNPGTHLELTMIEPGTSLEFNGRGLALIEWANAMKFTFFVSLLADLLFPWSLATKSFSAALIPGVLVYLAKLVAVIFLVALWEIAQAKLRLRAVSGALMAALGVAFIALVYVIMTDYL